MVAAIVLATGLLRPRHLPTCCFASMGVLTVSRRRTESRGALVATGVADDRRTALLLRTTSAGAITIGTLVAVAAMWFSFNPHAWQRISQFDSSGTGRTALWTVAWRITEDHPVTAWASTTSWSRRRSTRASRESSSCHNIAEKPHVAHNVYLQFLAETGFIGATLLCSCFSAAPRRMAGRAHVRLEGDATWRPRPRLPGGDVAFAAASFFLSDGNDVRFWLLLALGRSCTAWRCGSREAG